MDNKILIGFGVFLAFFLAFPFVAKIIREGGVESAQAMPASNATVNEDPERNLTPMLNAQNIVGTEWRVKADNYVLKVTIAPNGVCYATHPLLKSVTGMDYIEGRWRIEYDKAYIEAHVGNQHVSEVLTISGNNLYAGKVKVDRY